MGRGKLGFTRLVSLCKPILYQEPALCLHGVPLYNFKHPICANLDPYAIVLLNFQLTPTLLRETRCYQNPTRVRSFGLAMQNWIKALWCSFWETTNIHKHLPYFNWTEAAYSNAQHVHILYRSSAADHFKKILATGQSVVLEETGLNPSISMPEIQKPKCFSCCILNIAFVDFQKECLSHSP